MKIKKYAEKKVYITGGSSRTGFEIAKRLAGLGTHVFIFARDRGRLERTQVCISACRQNGEQQCGLKQMDVSEFDTVKEVLESAVADFGIPDILINSAGISTPDYFERIPYKQFEATMKINLFGVWNTIKILTPFLSSD